MGESGKGGGGGERSHIEKTERKRLKEQGEKEKEVDGIEEQSGIFSSRSILENEIETC